MKIYTKQRTRILNASILIFFIQFIICSQSYCQGNYRIENFGNRSILLSGNVTGSAGDLGLVYYNPSRLAILDNPSFLISSKAYELNKTSLLDAFGEGININDSKFNGIPSMIAGTFKLSFLPKDKFAYSFISRLRSGINLDFSTGLLEGDVIDNLEGAERFTGRIDLNDDITEEWFGLSWARKVTSNISIGASGFISIYEMKGSGRSIYAGEGFTDEVVTYSSYLGYNQKTYGLFFKLGASYVTSKFELGMNIHFPYINFVDEASFRGEEFLSGLGVPDDFFNFIDVDKLENKRKTSLGISFGAGIPVGKSKLHVSSEWYGGLKKYERISIPNLQGGTDEVSNLDFNEELKSIVNFGVGAEIFISSSVAGFLSFSSDFSSYVENSNLFDVINQNETEINYQSDYWHFGLGINATLNWGKFLLGTTYSRTASDFMQPLNFPTEPDLNQIDGISRLKLERWRFILGIEIPFLGEKLEDIKDKIIKFD